MADTRTGLCLIHGPAPLVRDANLAPAYTDRPSKWKVKKVLTAGFVSGDEWPAPGGNLASSIGPMMASLLQGCRACTCDFLITSFFGFGALPTPRVGSRNGRRLSAGLNATTWKALERSVV